MRLMISLVTGLLLPGLAAAQSAATGRLLIATPALTDPNFTETVVLIVHHSDEGSFGLFLNRPTWVDGGQAFEILEPLDESLRRLDFGGPVAVTQLLALVGEPGASEGSTEVTDGVHLTADVTGATATPGNGRIRIFAGHTVWGPEQLQEEIDDFYWRVVDGSAELVFDVEPDELLERVSALAESGLTANAP